MAKSLPASRTLLPPTAIHRFNGLGVYDCVRWTWRWYLLTSVLNQDRSQQSNCSSLPGARPCLPISQTTLGSASCSHCRPSSKTRQSCDAGRAASRRRSREGDAGQSRVAARWSDASTSEFRVARGRFHPSYGSHLLSSSTSTTANRILERPERDSRQAVSDRRNHARRKAWRRKLGCNPLTRTSEAGVLKKSSLLKNALNTSRSMIPRSPTSVTLSDGDNDFVDVEFRRRLLSAHSPRTIPLLSSSRPPENSSQPTTQLRSPSPMSSHDIKVSEINLRPWNVQTHLKQLQQQLEHNRCLSHSSRAQRCRRRRTAS